MNLFKKDPKHIFELVAAAILVLLAFFLVVYFTGLQPKKPQVKEPSAPPEVEKVEEKMIDYGQFGVVHMEVDSPSYAKSNFDVNPQTGITVYFNEAVSIEDVKERFSLVDKVSGAIAKVKVSAELRDPEEVGVPSAKKWQEVWQQKLVFDPILELEPVTMYVVEVSSGYFNELGTGSAGSNFRFEFLTADEPGILSTNLDNRDYEIKGSERVKVIFRSPMNEEELLAKASLGSLIELELMVNDKIMTIVSELEPGSYTLTIPANTLDIYDRPLDEGFVLEFNVV